MVILGELDFAVADVEMSQIAMTKLTRKNQIGLGFIDPPFMILRSSIRAYLENQMGQLQKCCRGDIYLS